MLFLLSALGFSSLHSEEKKNVKTTIRYKKYSEVDLSGAIIKGKIRTPEIFYIFQRKRSVGTEFVQVPANLDQHHQLTVNKLLEALPK